MKTLIYLCGIHSVGFAVFHVFFWRLFRWESQLKKLSLTNRAIMQILNIRLIYISLLVAFLCFRFPVELTTTALGKTFLAGMCLFWLGRTIEQFIFLRINHPTVHIVTALFIIGTVLFALPLFL
ncbi:hypothetical protein [Spirosoma areae]